MINKMNLVVSEDEYRNYTRVAETHDNNHADQWVDWGGHTITVDPMGNKQWIHDSHDGYQRSEERGRSYDADEVQKLQGWENDDTAAWKYYAPSLQEIDRLDKYTMPMQAGCRMWRGTERDSSRFGLLPSIEAMKRDGSLVEKGISQIEAEVREEERRRAHRLFV